MREFFRGWRRKVGVLMLIVALVFMGGWVRSPFVSDILNIPSGTYSFVGVASCNGSLGLARCHFPIPSKSLMPFHPIWEIDEFTHSSIMNLTLFDFDGCQWRWTRFGFGVYESSIDGAWMQCLQIPYWSIVLPLTLLSAYLLLIKPKPAKKAASLPETAI